MKPTLLLVDDDDTYWELVQIACARVGLTEQVALERLDNGDQVLPRLSAGRDGSLPFPSLVLLDQRMPGLHGIELVGLIRQEPAYKALPLGLMSSSNLPDEVSRAYASGASFYVVKPTAFSELVALFEHMTRFWFSTAQLPVAPRR